MMHKEFESSVCMCREDNGLGIFKSFSKKYSSVQLGVESSNLSGITKNIKICHG